MRVLIGVDTGLDGAVAVVLEDGTLARVENTPVYTVQASQREYDKAGMRELILGILRDFDPLEHSVRCFIERAPKQMGPRTNIDALTGITRSASLWEMGFGMHNVSTELVWPVSWKSKLKLMGTTKAASVGLAIDLWPMSVELFRSGRGYGMAGAAEGRAEAALIAEYGRRHG